MWGIFVGLVIGALQVMALGILGRMMLGGNPVAKATGVLLLIAKIAVIVLVLCLIANISWTHLLWTAAGMLVGLIAALALIMLRRRGGSAAGDSMDGKDGSDA
jgi:hypothetical protein